jgi:hypothetical protein
MNSYAARGSAISVGLDEFNRGRSDDQIIEAVLSEVEACWESDHLDIREWADMRTAAPTKEDIAHQALLVVETYINEPPSAFEVIEAEYIFRNHGNARADILARLPRGQVVAVDYKTKDLPTSQWLRSKIVSDFGNTWQMMHYCWALGEEFGHPVNDYGICLLWYSAKPKIEYVGYTVTDERLGIWLESAKFHWGQMEAILEGRLDMYEVADHDTKFGPCPYKSLCLDYNRDENYLEENFLRISR